MSRLDELLKRYIRRVADNSRTIMDELTEAIRQQPEREAQVGQAIDSLQRQLEDSRAQLKALLKRKIVDTMGKTPEQAQIISETYAELEDELTQRITGLEAQVSSSIDTRNELIQANRKAKTVIEVFESILSKPNLDKRDISLIIDRITVYEDHLDVKLKADIDALLRIEEEKSVNFPLDSKDISPELLVQSALHRQDKVFTVNVINSGDPLEIFTNSDGGVIFKKYSLMGGLGEFSSQLCEAVHKATGRMAAITDRDSILAAAGGCRKALTDRGVSPDLARLMEERNIYRHREGEPVLPVSDYTDQYAVSVAAPILSEGDVLGCVVFLCERDRVTAGETEHQLAQTIAGFLGRHMES